ncbi:MAG TPA: head GIN domain-containing protein [Allosphingosinicella sp.]|nr:head GIN domain-containing protein [Allosphingosinicella sp.]
MRATMMLAPLLMLAACGTRGPEPGGPSGQAGRRDFQVGAFDRVELAGSQNVIVTVGGAPSAYAEGDTGLLERLEVKVEGGVLRIGHKKGNWSFGRSKHRGSVTVHVTAPSLRGAEVAGSGDMRIDKVEGDEFAGAIAGSGELEVGSLRAKSTSFSIAGSGGVSASGAAETTDISIAGSGDVRAGRLEVKRAKVAIAGSGNVEAKATETADISIMGSGDAVITGTARCKVSKMGSGNARCGG